MQKLMAFEIKLNITDSAEPARTEEKISNKKAIQVKVRTDNISKGNFRFVPVMYL